MDNHDKSDNQQYNQNDIDEKPQKRHDNFSFKEEYYSKDHNR